MSNRFFTAFDIPDVISIVCCAGDKVEPIHSLAYDENGVPFLKEVGKRDVVAEINSYKDECDINRILMRYVNGDVTALGDFGGGFSAVSLHAASVPTNIQSNTIYIILFIRFPLSNETMNNFDITYHKEHM